jgi:hypothetical protein
VRPLQQSRRQCASELERTKRPLAWRRTVPRGGPLPRPNPTLPIRRKKANWVNATHLKVSTTAVNFSNADGLLRIWWCVGPQPTRHSTDRKHTWSTLQTICGLASLIGSLFWSRTPENRAYALPIGKVGLTIKVARIRIRDDGRRALEGLAKRARYRPGERLQGVGAGQ